MRIALQSWFHLATVSVALLCAALFQIIGYDWRRAPGYVIRNRNWLAANGSLVSVAVVALLFAPPPPPGSNCVETYSHGPMNMVLSCDSHLFVAGAHDPGTLLTPRSFSQPRPLGVMAAALLSLAQIRLPFAGVLASRNDIRRYPGWPPFVVINFVLLLLSLMVFQRLNAPATPRAAAATALLATFLTFSDVVKGFFWSAHTQMWNVLMPLISIGLSHALLREHRRSWAFMAACGLLLGFGFLCYASLAICAVSAVVAFAWAAWESPLRPPARQILGRLCLFIAAFAAPMLIWIALVRRVTGGFYSPEADVFREFVWVADTWKMGGFASLLQQARVRGADFLERLANVSWPLLLLLGILIIAQWTSPVALRETIRNRALLLRAAAITLPVCLAFFFLLGFYRNRLAFNVAVPGLVIGSVLITGLVERLPPRQGRCMLAGVAVAALAFAGSALLRTTWPY